MEILKIFRDYRFFTQCDGNFIKLEIKVFGLHFDDNVENFPFMPSNQILKHYAHTQKV